MIGGKDSSGQFLLEAVLDKELTLEYVSLRGATASNSSDSSRPVAYLHADRLLWKHAGMIWRVDF